MSIYSGIEPIFISQPASNALDALELAEGFTFSCEAVDTENLCQAQISLAYNIPFKGLGTATTEKIWTARKP
jgi:hypothetical protein